MFFEIPKAGDWIMKPELSKAHLNIEDRDLEYEKNSITTPLYLFSLIQSHKSWCYQKIANTIQMD